MGKQQVGGSEWKRDHATTTHDGFHQRNDESNEAFMLRIYDEFADTMPKHILDFADKAIAEHGVNPISEYMLGVPDKSKGAYSMKDSIFGNDTRQRKVSYSAIEIIASDVAHKAAKMVVNNDVSPRLSAMISSSDSVVNELRNALGSIASVADRIAAIEAAKKPAAALVFTLFVLRDRWNMSMEEVEEVVKSPSFTRAMGGRTYNILAFTADKVSAWEHDQLIKRAMPNVLQIIRREAEVKEEREAKDES
jgi:hypothetical protein